MLDRNNDLKYIKLIKVIKSNLNMSPIKSIDISQNVDYIFGTLIITDFCEEREEALDYEYNIYKWRNNYFKIERLNNFNYFNIYQKGEKLCGKDSYGNNLYFPINEECPINDIIITNSTINHQNLTDYKKVALDLNTFLYYTNKNIDGKIIIDFKINDGKGIPLNLEKNNYLCEYIDISSFGDEDLRCYYKEDNSINAEFYKSIDYMSTKERLTDELPLKNFNDNIYLYSLYYLGIIKEKYFEISENFQRLSNVKLAFSIILIFFPWIILIGIGSCEEKAILHIIFLVVNIIFIFINLIISIVCIKKMKYFYNFFIKEIIVYKRNGRNKKYEENDFLFNILIIILDFIHLTINIVIWGLFPMFKKGEGRNENNRIQRNNNRNQINTFL